MIERMRSHWWLFLIRGVFALILGFTALLLPGAAIIAVVFLFGAYALLDGIVAIVSAVRMSHAGGRWWLLILEGVAGIAFGIVTFVWPGISALTLALLVGVWAIVTGIAAVASALQARTHIPNEWLWIIAGAVSIAAGVVILFRPAAGLFALVYLLAFYAFIAGFAFIGLAFRLRRANAT